jgi:hypothetical protein
MAGALRTTLHLLLLHAAFGLKCYMYAEHKHVKAWAPDYSEEHALQAYYLSDTTKQVPTLQECPEIRRSGNVSLSRGTVCMNQLIHRVTSKGVCMSRSTSFIPPTEKAKADGTEFCSSDGYEYIRTCVAASMCEAENEVERSYGYSTNYLQTTTTTSCCSIDGCNEAMTIDIAPDTRINSATLPAAHVVVTALSAAAALLLARPS